MSNMGKKVQVLNLTVDTKKKSLDNSFSLSKDTAFIKGDIAFLTLEEKSLADNFDFDEI